MDLKSKGIAWVGDFYQKFETICHDVDNIVNQNPVKYVENQVNTVGKSVKKFCSGVVKEVDPVKCEAQAVAVKGNSVVGDYFKSRIGVEEYEDCMEHVNQSIVHPGDDDEYSVTTFDSEESVQEGNSDCALRRIDDVSVKENFCLSSEGDAIKKKINALEVLDHVLFSLDGVLPSTSVDGEEQKVEAVSCSPVNDSESMSDDSTAVVLSQRISSNGENTCVSSSQVSPSTLVDEKFHTCQEVRTDFYSLEKENYAVYDASGSVALSENNENKYVSAEKIFPSTLVHANKSESTQKVRTDCCRCANDSDTMSDELSVVAPSELALSSVGSPNVSIVVEPGTLHQTSCNNILTKAVSDGYFVDTRTLDSDSSTTLVTSASASIDFPHTEISKAGLSCSNSALSSESAGCSNDFSYIADDFDFSGLETIDLCDKAAPEESSVLLDDRLLYEASRRVHKLRSLKKKFQDVFNSKKRLSKEYELLPIWFGDSEMECSQHSVPQQLPSSTTTSVEPDVQIHDSEWELL